MGITINIRETAEKRGIKTAYRLQKRAGLSPSNASRLFNNNIVQISIDTLGKLCDVLDCEPNDLFVVDKSQKKSKG